MTTINGKFPLNVPPSREQWNAAKTTDEKKELFDRSAKKPGRRYSVSDLPGSGRKEVLDDPKAPKRRNSVSHPIARPQKVAHGTQPKKVDTGQLASKPEDPNTPPVKQKPVKLDIDRNAPEYKQIHAAIRQSDELPIIYEQFYSSGFLVLSNVMMLEGDKEWDAKLEPRLFGRSLVSRIPRLPDYITTDNDLKQLKDIGRDVAGKHLDRLAQLYLLEMERKARDIPVEHQVAFWMSVENPHYYGMTNAEFRKEMTEKFSAVRESAAGTMIRQAIEQITEYDDDGNPKIDDEIDVDKVLNDFQEQVLISDAPIPHDPNNFSSTLYPLKTTLGTTFGEGENPLEEQINEQKKKQQKIDQDMLNAPLSNTEYIGEDEEDDEDVLDLELNKTILSEINDSNQDSIIGPSVYKPGEPEVLIHYNNGIKNSNTD